MAIIQTTWNGYEVIGEKYKIRNISNSNAILKQIYLDNVNQYLLGSSNITLPQGFIFYQNLYAFKFFSNPIASSGVIENDLDVSFYLPGTEIPIYETPSIQNYNGYPGPMSVKNLPPGSPESQAEYLSGEGISVINPNENTEAYINLFNKPLRDYYRSNKTYTLRPYSSSNDEVEIFIIFTPSLNLKGLYESDLIINYEQTTGSQYTRKNTLKCLISDTNILEIDKTLENNIFSIDNVELEGNAIFIG